MNGSEVNLVSDPRSLGSSNEVLSDCSDICRDFLRNICSRGHHCRFRHPVYSRSPEVEDKTLKRPVCHDYQNGGCRRKEFCRFLHVTRKRERTLHDKDGPASDGSGRQMDLSDWNDSAGSTRRDGDGSVVIVDGMDIRPNEIPVGSRGHPVHRLLRNKRRSQPESFKRKLSSSESFPGPITPSIHPTHNRHPDLWPNSPHIETSQDTGVSASNPQPTPYRPISAGRENSEDELLRQTVDELRREMHQLKRTVGILVDKLDIITNPPSSEEVRNRNGLIC